MYDYIIYYWKQVVKFPNINIFLFISPFNPINIYFYVSFLSCICCTSIYICVYTYINTHVCLHIHIIIYNHIYTYNYVFCCIESFIIMSFFVLFDFDLKSILCHTCITMWVFFWLSFIGDNIFHLFTFKLCMFLNLEFLVHSIYLIFYLFNQSVFDFWV